VTAPAHAARAPAISAVAGAGKPVRSVN
jgi:hypothetical protein